MYCSVRLSIDKLLQAHDRHDNKVSDDRNKSLIGNQFDNMAIWVI
jgi:hypothetical protein